MQGIIRRYCAKCRKETNHTKLEKVGFLGQCLIAAVSKFSVSQEQAETECNDCGKQR